MTQHETIEAVARKLRRALLKGAFAGFRPNPPRVSAFGQNSQKLYRLRHRLIRWLALGDAIIMNCEVLADETFRTKNLRPFVVHGCDFSVDRGPALLMSHRHTEKTCALKIGSAPLEVSYCVITRATRSQQNETRDER